MKVTVFWEDSHGLDVDGFGPHVLLVRCLADELEVDVWRINGLVESAPKKGNANLLAETREGGKGSLVAPAVAVFDSDKTAQLLSPVESAAVCIPETVRRLAKEASDGWTIVLLERNVETLLDVASDVLARPRPKKKLRPNDRDALLREVAKGDPSRRAQVRKMNKSFDRLVRRVAELLRAAEVANAATSRP